MAELWIIADDYGLGADHDRVMRQLLKTGAINAVSVLVDLCSEQSASALIDMANEKMRIGLHVNLTLAAPGAAPRPNRAKLLARSLIGLDGKSAEGEIRAQRARFEDLFGRTPDFIDGHEHCHAFPTIRPTILRMALEDGVAVRSMVPFTAAKSLKEWVIVMLGRRIQVAALRQGIKTNWRFGGILPIDDPETASAKLCHDIRDARKLVGTAEGEIWFMVHPGDKHDPVQVPGHPPRLRSLEAEVLSQMRYQPLGT